MTVDDRWLDVESEALGRSLIDAGRAERPSRAALTRTLAALGTGVAVTAVATKTGAAAAGASIAGAALGGSAGTSLPAAASGTAASLLLGKWVVGLAVVGVGAFGAVQLLDEPSQVVAPKEAQRPALVESPSEVAPLPVPAPVEEVPVVAPEPTENVVERVPAARPKRTSAPRAERVEVAAEGPGAAIDGPSALEEELSLIDEARALIDGGKPGAALAKLTERQTRFPKGRLGPEASFLRMQAHVRLGNDREAKRVAQSILEHAPNGPHAGRAREVLQR